ncbi:MAG: hypothetical protein GY943_16255 [Chloroflexi bacterium]|nr:hypothetical protein [Chloroflexota bacterium]
MDDECIGWLLDVYTDEKDGLVVWLLGEDGGHHRLKQPCAITFYASGDFARLRALWRYLSDHPAPCQLSRTIRQDLFAGAIDVMAIQVEAHLQPSLFRQTQQLFPDLDYYDADIPISVRYAAQYDLFPMLRCRATVKNDVIIAMKPLDSRWEINLPQPPLCIMTMEPNVDPSLAEPTHLILGTDGKKWHYSLQNQRLLLIGLQAQLKRHNPDLILTRWGDSWLFPQLIKMSQETAVLFNPSRDPMRFYQRKRATSYFTYGMVIYRSEQIYLYGRYHIDIKNTPMFNQYDLDGTLEQVRVSGMAVQEMARRSPGAGITAMQMITALRRGVLVPFTKQQAEYSKSARQLLRSDRGGLVFQPKVGLHKDVVEIDFVSMYPSIISLFNVSPETVAINSDHITVVPELNLPIDQTQRGLLPETLQPLLDKRIEIKSRLSKLTPSDCRKKSLKARSTALKWLLVVAFGYAGYKRARYGRIETHEAITAYSREALLRAKEAAEALGYEVLHMYVDGLWVKRKGIKCQTAVQPLLDEVERRTGLPIALEGFYKWIAFLPSKVDPRIPVPNRYFGVFENGVLKVRGIELRRHDTPLFVANIQSMILEQLAKTIDLASCLPKIIHFVQQQFAHLRANEIPTESLLVSQILSRAVEEYRVPSPAARAARQLQTLGRPRFPGQRIQFVFTRSPDGVYAWGLPEALDRKSVDVERYVTLALRAITAVLQPFNIDEEWLQAQILGWGWQRPLPLSAPFLSIVKNQPTIIAGFGEP